MLFFEDTSAEEQRIKETIKKYGDMPEHNFPWYQCQAEKKYHNVFVQRKNGMGILTIEEEGKKESTVFSSPLAPCKLRAEFLCEYITYVFCSGRIIKVFMELEDELYKEFIKNLQAGTKARRVNYTLTWPIYDLGLFDSSLCGNKWKSLRKTKNKFYQNHIVTISDAKKYNDKKSLHLIIDEWRKARKAHDRAYFIPYHTFIDKNFEGASEARVFAVDGRACGINAGWLIPNSNRFYGAMGIHDYSLPGLGDVLYLEDLSWLKAKGYKEADMGGGEKALTEFKTKFHPKSFYKTRTFSVIKS